MRKFRLTTAAALLALASAAAPMSADAAVPASCPLWHTGNFHWGLSPEDAARCLLAGMDPNVDLFFGDRPLHYATRLISHGPEVIELLLKHGAEPNAAGQHGYRPLHAAAEGIVNSRQVEKIAALLKGGADPNAQDNSGDTPLHLAAINGHPEAVDALLKGGADPNRVNNKGWTPLHKFADLGTNNPELLTRLIRGGADPNLLTPEGDTALHLAISRRGSPTIPVIEALLAGGADPCILNAKGFIPYHLADEGSEARNVLSSAGGHDDPSVLTSLRRNSCAKREGRPTVRGPGSGVAPVPAEVARNKCEGKEEGAVCWKEITNRPGCYLLDDYYYADQTVTWSETCRGGVAEGAGTLVLTREGKSDSYTGSMNAGERHGRWVIRFANGTVAEASYENGRPHGRVVIRFADGDVYEGPYENGKKHGRWVERSADGTVYEGTYENGKKHGRWVERFTDGTVGSITTWDHGNIVERSYGTK